MPLLVWPTHCRYVKDVIVMFPTGQESIAVKLRVGIFSQCLSNQTDRAQRGDYNLQNKYHAAFTGLELKSDKINLCGKFLMR